MVGKTDTAEQMRPLVQGCPDAKTRYQENSPGKGA